MKQRLYKINTVKVEEMVSRLLGEGSRLKVSKKENLPDDILRYVSNHRRRILEIAVENDFAFNLDRVSKNSLAGLFRPSRAKSGSPIDAISCLTALFIHALGRNCGVKSPLELLDSSNDPSSFDEFESYRRESLALTAQENTLEQSVDSGMNIQIRPLLEEKEFQWVAEAQRKLYGDDAISREKYDEWYTANPSGFFIFYLNDNIIGHLTLIPFIEERWAPYRRGEIREKELCSSDIWGTRDTDKMTLLYVESYILTGTFSKLATPSVRLSFLEMANEVMPISDATMIYAMNATIKGTNSIERLGFELHQEESATVPRIDGHQMYVTSVGKLRSLLDFNSPKNLRRILLEISNIERRTNQSAAASTQKWCLLNKLQKLKHDVGVGDFDSIEKNLRLAHLELRSLG